jgi:hypothetical protein
MRSASLGALAAARAGEQVAAGLGDRAAAAAGADDGGELDRMQAATPPAS